jgi:nicotinate-nucleotide adenylyltransferase
MEKQHLRIGVSGGTFDPIHFGHLIAAEHIRDSFKLDKLLFIPSGVPPHKNNAMIASAEDRFNMVAMAVKSNPYFEASSLEISRQGYTYSVDTLLQLREKYGSNVQIYFIIGADVVLDLLTWRDIEKVFGLCEFIATLRPGYKNDQLLKRIEFLKLNYMAKIHTADIPLIEISSTKVRKSIEKGKSIKYLVPDDVENYISNKGLYLEVKNN